MDQKITSLGSSGLSKLAAQDQGAIRFGEVWNLLLDPLPEGSKLVEYGLTDPNQQYINNNKTGYC